MTRVSVCCHVYNSVFDIYVGTVQNANTYTGDNADAAGAFKRQDTRQNSPFADNHFT